MSDVRTGCLTVDSDKGVISLCSGPICLKDGTSRIALPGRSFNPFLGAEVDEADTGLVVSAVTDPLHFRLDATATGNWIRIKVRITNPTEAEILLEPLTLMEFKPESIELGCPPCSVRQLFNCRWLADRTVVRRPFGDAAEDIYERFSKSPLDDDMPFDAQPTSWLATALWNPQTRLGVTMGFGRPMTESSYFHCDENGLRVMLFFEGRSLLAGQSVLCPELFINLSDEPREALIHYARLAGSKPRELSSTAFINWNSFDFYRNTVTQQDVVENMQAIIDEPVLRERIRYIVVDSGWEYAWGEYEALAHRFPAGTAGLARVIKDHGFVPGIWVAPLMVRRDGTYLSHWRPDMLMKDEQGHVIKCLNGAYNILDPTHPDSEKTLRDWFGRLVRDGFELFKCDYLVYGLMARRLYDPAVTPTMAVRRTLEIIRGVIGPERVLLCCMAPIESVVGLADFNRISVDMHNFWSNVQIAGRNIQWRYWMHGVWFYNDPDMFPVRGPDTAQPPLNPYYDKVPHRDLAWETGSEFNLNEARFWATVTILSGGLFTACDKLTLLKPQGKHILTKTLSLLCSNAPTPLDFYESPIPSVLLQEYDGGYRLGILNWWDEQRIVTVDYPELAPLTTERTTLEDEWTGMKVTWPEAKTRGIRLPGRTARLFNIVNGSG